MKTFKLNNETKITSGFRTPENYFENFSDNVLNQLQEREVKIIPIYKRKKVYAMLAAAVIFVAFMIPIVNNYNITSKDLDQNTLETYLAYQSNLNQYDLVNALDTKDIDELGQNVALEKEILEDILTSNPNLLNLISE